MAQYREQFKWESPLLGVTLLSKVSRSSLTETTEPNDNLKPYGSCFEG